MENKLQSADAIGSVCRDFSRYTWDISEGDQGWHLAVCPTFPSNCTTLAPALPPLTSLDSPVFPWVQLRCPLLPGLPCQMAFSVPFFLVLVIFIGSFSMNTW
jgi:hypothetical protein